jgi:predicted nucleotidyltransferase
MLQEHFQTILDALLRACADFYRERLVSAAVFGSIARGTMRPDSDIDLLLVVNGLPSGRMPRVSEFEAVERRLAPLLEEAARGGVNTSVSPVFKTPQELVYGSPLFLDMTEEILILHDPHAVLQNYLEHLRRRLKALGSRRIGKGGGYYWLLKPDLKPGEDFTL